MKVIHIADCHLLMEPEKGTPIGALRRKEIMEIVPRIVEVCNAEEADLLLIAGDLFHKAPRLMDLRELDHILSGLVHTKVVLIAGNHDYIGPRSHYTNYPWKARVTMLTDGELSHVAFPELRTTVYGFSYHTRDITEPLYDNVAPVGEGIHILLAHGGDAKNVPMNYKKIDLAGFDYAALGHIHKKEILTPRMAYAGSVEPLDRNETGEHGYMRVDIVEEAGEHRTEVTFVPFSQREYRDITVMVDGNSTNASIGEAIKAMIAELGAKHLYRVALLGKRNEELVPDTEAFLGLGNITEVIDRTLPEYDLKALRKANADNLLGMFIEALSEENGEDAEIREKALYYGLSALLNK